MDQTSFKRVAGWPSAQLGRDGCLKDIQMERPDWLTKRVSHEAAGAAEYYQAALNYLELNDSLLACDMDWTRAMYDSFDAILMEFCLYYVKVEGITWAWQQVEDFRHNAEVFGPTQLLGYIKLQHPAHCDCEREYTAETWRSEPQLIWLHANHGLFNYAMWGVLTDRQIDRLARALRDDIRYPERINLQGLTEGLHLERRYACQLKCLLRRRPDVSWFARTPVTIAA
jgi:hypothetical protein